MSQSWKRLITVGEDGQKYYLPPRQDVYAFDLYIPLMAIFTFIVTVGFTAGTKGIFSPQIISTSLSACSVSIILEVVFFARFHAASPLEADSLPHKLPGAHSGPSFSD